MANGAHATGHAGKRHEHVLSDRGGADFLRRLILGPGWQRRRDWLEARIDMNLKTLVAHPSAGEPSKAPGWWRIAKDLVDAADDALQHRALDLGWRYIHAAERTLVAGFDEARLTAEAIAIREECKDKLHGWRRESTTRLLAREEWATLKTEERAHRIRQVLEIRDEHYADRWMQHDVLRAQLILVIWLIAAFAALLTYFVFQIGPPPEGAEPSATIEDRNLLLAIITAGLLGGGMSAFLTFAAPPDEKIPAQLLEHVVTFFRTFFGGAAALAFYFLLGSPLADDIFAFDATAYPIVIFVSFAAGFSERLVRKGVEKVAG